MSGVDTVRGIAFQHAHAVLAALEVLGDDDLGSVRVEGTDDVVDIEVFGSDGALRTAKQVKSRQQHYSWGRSELSQVFTRWAALPGVASASFVFITDGRLGPTGQKFADALATAAKGDMTDLAALVRQDRKSEMCRVLARASVRVEVAGLEALIDQAELLVRSMLPDPRTPADAQAEAERRVNRLAIRMLGRAGNPDPGRRLFTRDEIAEILEVPVDQPPSARWPGRLRDRYLSCGASLPLGHFADSLMGARAPSMPHVRAEGTGDTPRPVSVLLQGTGAVVLAGRTGTGKSTSAEMLRREGAQQGRVVLVASAEAYIPGCLPALAADAISEVIGEDFPAATGRQALADKDVTLIIDGVSEVPDEIQAGLREELRAPLAAGRGARCILIGRNRTVVQSILPTSRPPSVYCLVDFEAARRLDFACRVFWQTGADDPEIAGQMEEAREAIACAEQALDDAAGNPLLLTMALILIRGGVAFSERAGLYRGFIELLAQRSGIAAVDKVTAALGIAYAALLDQGRRYAGPIEWARLIKDAAGQLSDLGIPADAITLAADARRCGLIVTGGWRQTILPLHDSFADFLAGSAHAQQLAPLPQRAVEGDRQRLLFAAEAGGTGPELTSLVTRDLPFLVVRMARWDQRNLADTAPDELRTILEHLSARIDFGIGLWKVDRSRTVVFRDGQQWRWINADEAEILLARVPWIAIDDPRLLTVAARIWRQSLIVQLEPQHGLPPRQPRTQDEARDLLEQHLREAAAATSHLVAKISPPGQIERLRSQVGPLGLDAIIQLPEQILGTTVWPVICRKADTVNVSKFCENGLAPSAQGGEAKWRNVLLDRLILSGPQGDAIRRVRTAIEELTMNGWLTP